jgi:hypothetical protein
MPITREKLITWQSWKETLATTESDEVLDLVTVLVAENSAIILHLFIVVKNGDGSNAAFYSAEALFRRETGQDVELVSAPSGHQTSDGDFTPQNPDVEFAVDVGTQSALVQVEGLSGVPLQWVAQAVVIRRL